MGLGSSAKKKQSELYYARVESVDETARTCTVTVLGPNGFALRNIPYSAPMVNADGSGIDFVPTRGCTCIVLKQASNHASEEDQNTFILSFRPNTLSEDRSSWQGDRLTMAEGDVILSSPEMNRLELLSNGVTKVMANEVCSIEMSPDTQKIETLCNQYSLITAGGYVDWAADDSEENGSAHLKFVAKATSTPEVGASELFIFEAGDAGEPKVTMKVLDPEGGGDAGKLLWTCNSEGEMLLDVKKTVTINVGEATAITSLGGLSVTAPSLDYSIGTASSSFTPQEYILNVPEVTIKTDRFRVISRSQEQVFIDTGTERVEDTLNKQLVTEDILAWLFNHVHPSTGMPGLGRPVDTTEFLTEPVTSASSAQALSSMISSVPFDEILAKIALVNPGDNPPSSQNNLSSLYPFLQTPPDAQTTPLVVQMLIEQIIATSQILHERLQLEHDELAKAVGTAWTSGDAPVAGALVSYGQVLTQETKVR